MALRNLHLKNFRGISEGTFLFHPRTRITGANGVGKSTIKEAICFVFTGTDSHGIRNPQHLITQGQTFTEVVITTDKAVLSRRINDKGVTQIKMLLGDVSHPLTQSQVETMVGSPDLFLSTLIPGYFMSLSTEKQQKILSDILPPLDRRKVLEEITGIRLTDQETLQYGLNRRIDLVASTIAGLRRDKEKALASIEGEAKGIMRAIEHMEVPVEPKEASEVLGKQTLLREAWENHRRREEEHFQAEVRSLRAQYRPMPERPVLAQEVSSDNCPTCGMIVGSRHKEKVQKMNQTALESYEAKLGAAQAHNRELEGRIEETERKLFKVQRSTEFYLDGKPSENYDSYVHNRAQEQVKNYLNQATVYKKWQGVQKTAQTGVADLQHKVQAYSQEVGRLRVLEEKAWELPKIEFARQMELLKMKDVVIDMTDAITIFWKGLPYYSISEGQKMRVGIELCKKFNSLLKKPLNVIFLDNAELMDTRENITPDVQWFVCEVNPTVQSLVISE